MGFPMRHIQLSSSGLVRGAIPLASGRTKSATTSTPFISSSYRSLIPEGTASMATVDHLNGAGGLTDSQRTEAYGRRPGRSPTRSRHRTIHGAPNGISTSISFQHPFNRAGGRTSNVHAPNALSTSAAMIAIPSRTVVSSMAKETRRHSREWGQSCVSQPKKKWWPGMTRTWRCLRRS